MENIKLGEPCNTKSLLAFIFMQMHKLDTGQIDAQTAAAQAKLAKQANNLLDYELKRTIVQLQLEKAQHIEGTPRLREIESKAF